LTLTEAGSGRTTDASNTFIDCITNIHQEALASNMGEEIAKIFIYAKSLAFIR